MTCIECYSPNNRATPLLNPRHCLETHQQYICGTCGRCICIDKDEKRKVQRWNFPFKSLDIAKLYLRTADLSNQKSCGIYQIVNSTGRESYKIFANSEDLTQFLHKNKDKTCPRGLPIYIRKNFQNFSQTNIAFLDMEEVERYVSEQELYATRF